MTGRKQKSLIWMAGRLGAWLLAAMPLRAYVEAAETHSRDRVPGNRAATKQSLQEFLTNVGVRLDCYFTIETFSKSPLKIASLNIADVNIKPDVTTRDLLIAKLRKELPGTMIVHKEDRPAIIHIIAEPLHRMEGYSLNRVCDVVFTGTPRGLVEKLGTLLDGLGPRTSGGFSGVTIDDAATPISVRAQNRPVREVLTDCIPLSAYYRLLWIADTTLAAGHPRTTVTYRCPRRSGGGRWIPTTPTVPFLQGEMAYVGNPVSETTVADAMRFVTSRMKSPDKHQVRWAMLFLGKHKIERAGPLLVEHVDYEYTRTALAEEAFPAVRALISMGPVAQDVILQAVSTETDAKRLELLCRAYLGIQRGELVLSSQDWTQQQRTRRALSNVIAPMVRGGPGERAGAAGRLPDAARSRRGPTTTERRKEAEGVRR